MLRPEYKEKEFLIYLYDNYTNKNAKDLSALDNHSFGLIPSSNNPICKRFPELCKNNNISDPIYWCDKTENLGYTKYPSGDSESKLSITLTEKGYWKAYSYKHPLKSFLKVNYKWIIAVIAMPIIISLLKIYLS